MNLREFDIKIVIHVMSVLLLMNVFAGITGLFFRVFFGYVGDKRFVNRTALFGMAALGAGLMMIAFMFNDQYYYLATVTIIFAVFSCKYCKIVLFNYVIL